MKIWIVEGYDQSILHRDWQVLGVFSTKAKAEQFVERNTGIVATHCVYEMEVDVL